MAAADLLLRCDQVTHADCAQGDVLRGSGLRPTAVPSPWNQDLLSGPNARSMPSVSLARNHLLDLRDGNLQAQRVASLGELVGGMVAKPH